MSGNSSKKPRTKWLPPPRPPELRNIHVIDLNEELSDNIDYFALIHDRKRELEKRRVDYTDRSKQRTIPRAPEETVNNKPQRLITLKSRTEPKAMPPHSSPDFKESAPAHNVKSFFSEHRQFLAAAAALGFVFVG